MRNRKIILLISGEIGSGKSTLCESLKEKFDFTVFRSKDALIQTWQERGKHLKNDRKVLQRAGQELDTTTNGAWLVEFFQADVLKYNRIVIDAVRISSQIDSFRKSYGHSIVHIHLWSSDPDLLRDRFFERKDSIDNTKEAGAFYDSVKRDKTEKQVNSLEKKADLVIDTARNKPDDVLIRVAGFLKILPPINNELVDVLVGGQFGSEGKGQVAAYLAPNYDCLVRVGGPNAGHKVFAEPTPHVFHILPSGCVKNPAAKLVIGPGAVINKDKILEEIRKFEINEPDRLIIDPNATIISPEDIEFEKRASKIGSTAQGVGKATAENILHRLREDSSKKASNCAELKQYIGSSHEVFEKLFDSDKRILLEGTQGTHLSLHHGIYPYVTSRDTCAGGCLAEAGIAINRVRKIILVARTYPIRVQSPSGGTSGGFVSDEISLEEISDRSGVPIDELKVTETTTTTKKQRRIAEFSWALFRKACELNSPTDIALTFADYISLSNQEARRYDQLSPETTKFIDEIERCAGVPVSLIATRFSYRSIIDRRNWI